MHADAGDLVKEKGKEGRQSHGLAPLIAYQHSGWQSCGRIFLRCSHQSINQSIVALRDNLYQHNKTCACIPLPMLLTFRHLRHRPAVSPWLFIHPDRILPRRSASSATKKTKRVTAKSKLSASILKETSAVATRLAETRVWETQATRQGRRGARGAADQFPDADRARVNIVGDELCGMEF